MRLDVAVAGQPIESTKQATVFIVDDDSDVRQTVSLLVRSVDLNAEEFESANEFLEKYDPDRPGCLVLDMRMPGMTGFQLQQKLIERGFQPPIIFVTGHGDILMATAALRAGAVEFIPKPFNPQLLLERIHEAIALDSEQRRERAHRRRVDGLIAKLTDREQQVMKLLAAGESTKVIAKHLGISQKTVDNHRAKVLEKMGVDNAAQLALLIH